MPIKKAGEVGTALPDGKGLYDVIGAPYVDEAGGFQLENLRDDIRTIAQYLIDGTAGGEAGTALPAGKSLYTVLANLPASMRGPYLDEFWETEAIDAAVWTTSKVATGSLPAIEAATHPGYVTVHLTGVANNDYSRLVGVRRWACIPKLIGGDTMVKKLCMELEINFTDYTGCVGGNSGFGFASTALPLANAVNSVTFYTGDGATLYARTADADTYDTSGNLGACLNNWRLCRIEISAEKTEFFIDGASVHTCTDTADMPDSLMYPFVTLSIGATATPDMYIGKVRIWYETALI